MYNTRCIIQVLQVIGLTYKYKHHLYGLDWLKIESNPRDQLRDRNL